jgi:hypothetical protein
MEVLDIVRERRAARRPRTIISPLRHSRRHLPNHHPGRAGRSTFAFVMKAKPPQEAQITQLSRFTAKVMKQPDHRPCGPLPLTSGTIGSALPFGLVAWSTGVSVSAN